MASSPRPTILCLASYFKGGAFLQACKRLGCRVLLLVKANLADESWPWDSIDEHYRMPDLSKRPDIIHAVSYLARTNVIDRIVPLDDYDVETAAALREHLRIPGMGDTTVRHFRDKLAMRVQAHDKGIRVPEFVHVLNYDRLREFMARVPPPWVFKPRSEAGAMGIKRVNSPEELWRWLDTLGDQQSFYVLEQYIPGEVFHVDSIVSEREVVFSVASRYWQPPMDVAHGGGIFCTRVLRYDSADAEALRRINREMLAAMNMVRGVTHAEFIKGRDDGQFYFLETAARVGGANIAEMVEAASGLDLWGEWAAIEHANALGRPYQLRPYRQAYAGILICLARQEFPDLSTYHEPEVVWRMKKKHHAGLIVASPDQSRVEKLLEAYRLRFAHDFLAVMPAKDKPD
jgi:biotin carboxylase